MQYSIHVCYRVIVGYCIVLDDRAQCTQVSVMAERTDVKKPNVITLFADIECRATKRIKDFFLSDKQVYWLQLLGL